jgi:hypothetical protein
LFSTNDSSQVALPDVFRQQILSLRREHEMLSRWDQTMNMVYPAAQFILPLRALPQRVAQKRIATPSTDEKCKLMEARIEALAKLIW